MGSTASLGERGLPEDVVDQVWDDGLGDGAHHAQAGVGVHLDEPQGQLVVDHEVQSEELERALSVLRVQLRQGSQEAELGVLLRDPSEPS